MEEKQNARAHMLQRKQRLEALITKRTLNLQYLRKFHEGEHFWMNISLMTKSELYEYVDKHVPPQRTLSFFYLGISLSKIYDSTIGLHKKLSEQYMNNNNSNNNPNTNTNTNPMPPPPELIPK